jgi:ABC-2 type transport system permease protein
LVSPALVRLAVNIVVPLVASLGIVIVGAAAFGVPLPIQPAGFIIALILTAAVMLTLGLLVASVARTGRVAGAVGGLRAARLAPLPLGVRASLIIPVTRTPSLADRGLQE